MKRQKGKREKGSCGVPLVFKGGTQVCLGECPARAWLSIALGFVVQGNAVFSAHVRPCLQKEQPTRAGIIWKEGTSIEKLIQQQGIFLMSD